MAVRKPLLVATAALTVPVIVAAGVTGTSNTAVSTPHLAQAKDKPDTQKTETRASKKDGKIKLSKKRKNRKTTVRLYNLPGKIKFVATYKNRKKKTKTTGKKKFSLHKNVVRVRFSKSKYATLTTTVSNRKFSRTFKLPYAGAGTPGSKPAPSQRNPINDPLFDSRRGNSASYVLDVSKTIDPCSYVVGPASAEDLSPENYVIKSATNTNGNIIYWGGPLTTNKTAREDLNMAFARVGQITGHRFVRDPSKEGRTNYMRADVEMAEPGVDGASGTGGGDYSRHDGRIFPFFNASLNYSSPRPVNVNVLQHEIMHAMGLWHVNDVNQLMYPTISWSRDITFGAGDYAGLRKLRYQPGCHAQVGDWADEAEDAEFTVVTSP